MNISTTLTGLGYLYNSDAAIWMHPSYPGIQYNDGDEVENRIASVIKEASDLSVLSTELRQYCIDWPSLYHLTGTRANIMRPFEAIYKNAQVLEIGAGCGAITRYLGESSAHVLALEGSPRRAAIARSRTRDLDNVTVLAEKFDQFKYTEKFDVVTLIGVLEYANLFTPGDNPALSMLERVRQLLKPEGKLIIAIENQLGLKYFAGAPEDHLGQPMIGIEGRYRQDQPQTYGRKKLQSLLSDAKFSNTSFLAPFPDYKLPVSIITEAGFSAKNFDASALVWQGVKRDPQLPSKTNFSLELTWPQLFENELALDVSNSFLIIASKNAEKLVSEEVLAFHFSTDRVDKYCKSTVFMVDEFKKIHAIYNKLQSNPIVLEPLTKPPVLEFVCPPSDKYIFGKTLSLEFLHLVTQDGWSLDDVNLFVRKYFRVLKEIFAAELIFSERLDKNFSIPAKYFDAIPHNIIVDEKNAITLIDNEWKYTNPLEIGYLLFRAVLWSSFSITRFGKPASSAEISNFDLMQSAFLAIGWEFQEADYQRYSSQESRVQELVSGRSVGDFYKVWRNAPLPILSSKDWSVSLEGQLLSAQDHLHGTQALLNVANVNLSATERRLVDADSRLIDTEIRLAEKFYEIGLKDAQILDQDNQIRYWHNRIFGIEKSTSWRLTSPIRYISHLGKKIILVLKYTAPVIRTNGGLTASFKSSTVYVAEHGIKRAAKKLNSIVLNIKKTSTFDNVNITNQAAINTIQISETINPKDAFRHLATIELNSFLEMRQRFVFKTFSAPSISILIVVWNSAHLTFKCLQSLIQEQNTHDCPDFEIIIFNNASSDITARLLTYVDGIRVVNSDENLGFLLGCNQAAAIATGKTILLLNSDAFVRAGALKAAYDTLCADPANGAVGARIVLPSGLLQEAGSIVWNDASTYGYCRGEQQDSPAAMYKRKVDYCSGAFLLTPLAIWQELNGFDKSFAPAYYEEVDYCLRLTQSGYDVIYDPNVVVDHYEFGSENKAGDSTILMLKNRALIQSKHKEYLSTKFSPGDIATYFAACNINTNKKGRLLIFDDQVPYMSLGAGLPRMRAILNAAAVDGWQVTFFAVQRLGINWTQVKREFHSEIEFITNIENNQISNFIASRLHLIDIIFVSRPTNMSILNSIFEARPDFLLNIKLIYDAEAVFSHREYLFSKLIGKTMSEDTYLKSISSEIKIAKYATVITCVSANEAFDFNSQLNVEATVLGHSIEISNAVKTFESREDFLFVGRLLEDDSPNRLGLSWFIKLVWPKIRNSIPNAHLNVIGHVSEKHDDLIADGVSILGAVDDLTLVYSQHKVFVAPIQFAAGIPIKIIEAAATGLPVVATDLMASQLNWSSGMEIQSSDDPVVMANIAVQLYGNKELWDKQSQAALVRVHCEYSSSAFKQGLTSMLNKSITSKHT